MGCAAPGCRGHHYGLGWCSMHYQRVRKHGDPTVCTGRRTAADWLLDLVLNADPEPCVDWPFARNHAGYGVVRVGGRSFPAHRLACELLHGRPATPELHAAHSCGRPTCVNPHHVRWATATENQADRIIHGTDNRGERCGISKLTVVAVQEIRALAAAGVRQCDLAEQFDVSRPTISDIVRGKSWGWL